MDTDRLPDRKAPLDKYKPLDLDVEAHPPVQAKFALYKRTMLVGLMLGCLLFLFCWAGHHASTTASLFASGAVETELLQSDSQVSRRSGTLIKRMPLRWQDCVEKGRENMAIIRNPIRAVPSSPFNPNELTGSTSAWSSRASRHKKSQTRLVPEALAQIGVDWETDEDLTTIVAEQDRRYTSRTGQQHYETRSRYDFVVGPKDGLILVTTDRLRDPGYAIRPNILYLYDVAALEYINSASIQHADATQFRYLIHTYLDQLTASYVDMIRVRLGHQHNLPTWQQGPVVLHEGDDHFDGVVGTPLGCQMTVMLVRYRGILSQGIKIPTEIKLWQASNGRPTVMFEFRTTGAVASPPPSQRTIAQLLSPQMATAGAGGYQQMSPQAGSSRQGHPQGGYYQQTSPQGGNSRQVYGQPGNPNAPGGVYRPPGNSPGGGYRPSGNSPGGYYRPPGSRRLARM